VRNDDASNQVVAECDANLARNRAALEAGADPKMIAAWTSEAQARKARALATRRAQNHPTRMSRDEIRADVDALGNVAVVLA
jgi:site-specific DNA recombinase